MGRKTLVIEKISDERDRRVCFKKRRIGLLKKAIQLSKLSGCEIEIKVYNEEDQSLLHYLSEKDHDLQARAPYSSDVTQYMKFLNANEDIVNKLENKITSHLSSEKEQGSFLHQIETQLEGYNILQFFSFQKASS